MKVDDAAALLTLILRLTQESLFVLRREERTRHRAGGKSFILGTSVRLEFETGNGTLAFVGTLSQDGSELSGNYSISGSTCDGEGAAVLLVSSPSPWDY